MTLQGPWNGAAAHALPTGGGRLKQEWIICVKCDEAFTVYNPEHVETLFDLVISSKITKHLRRLLLY